MYRVEASEDATPQNVSTALDAIAAGSTDDWLNLSPDGQWLLLSTDRFTTAQWDDLLESRDLETLQVSDFEMLESGARIPYTGDCVREP